MTGPYRYLRAQALECLKNGTLFTQCERQPTRLAYGEAMLEVGALIPEVVLCTADVSVPMDTVPFSKRFPERACSRQTRVADRKSFTLPVSNHCMLSMRKP